MSVGAGAPAEEYARSRAEQGDERTSPFSVGAICATNPEAATFFDSLAATDWRRLRLVMIIGVLINMSYSVIDWFAKGCGSGMVLILIKPGGARRWARHRQAQQVRSALDSDGLHRMRATPFSGTKNHIEHMSLI